MCGPTTDGGEVVFHETGMGAVDSRDDLMTCLREPWKEGRDHLTRVCLFGHGDGVFHIGDDGIGLQSDCLFQHVGPVAGHEQEASQELHDESFILCEEVGLEYITVRGSAR